ncbi:ABC-type amino acid transporter [Bacillus amyloliquefaciens]|nr:ABC-type amino acid transporter [Bacillus amyloliquefaciens]
MKKKTWALLLSAALLAVLSACGNGKESEGGDNVLHVGATGQSYPFAYKENGKLTGFDVDVMEAVAKKST